MSCPSDRADPAAALAAAAHDLGDLLRRLAAAHGDRAATTDAGESQSFAALDRAADRWAAGFAHAGCGPGRHVGLLAGNGPTWLAIAFGAWRAGATLVPISTFVTSRELREVLLHADIDALVTVPRLAGHDYLAQLREAGALPRRCEVIVLDASEAGEFRAAAGFPRDGGQALPAPDPASAACILYTSGTTGEPKGVVLSHRAILATVGPTAGRSGLTPRDSLLSTLPLFWVAGLVIRALPTLTAGCELILVPRFTAMLVIDALRRHRPTGLHLRPPQIAEVLQHPDFGPALLANLRRGGGRTAWYCPPLALDDARFITGYGMTEMAGYVVALDWRDPPAARATGFGTPLPGVELRIVDESGRPCAAGAPGEIRVRGPGLFTGYYKQPRGAGLDADGFFMTGDVGSVAEDGTFHFTGRTKDLLRSRGINVAPLEVETVLAGHPGVEAAYVVGLPPDGLDQHLVALIVPARDNPATEADLRELSANQLSHYKRPECYVFIAAEDIPLSGTSKPRRQLLADLAQCQLSGGTK